MAHNNFNEVINFAVDREKEAVKFYQEMQTMAAFTGMKEFLKELEEMEQGHIVILEEIRSEQGKNIETAAVTNLNLSDYLVKPAKEQAAMDYQDLLVLAMKREDAASKLYTHLANNAADSNIKKLFDRLAHEESRHKLKFEELYDQDVLNEN